MTSDEKYMQRALDLAQIAGVNAAPNPMVGAVIVLNDAIIGEGFHQRCGEAHAEVNAINSVQDKNLLKDATIYVTLEPCAHHGKTGPCADLLVQHRLKRVVIGCIDPFPKVAGKGISILKTAGIDVEVGCLTEKCVQLNRRFFTFHAKKRPYVFLKWAQTANGLIDNDANDARSVSWISQPETQILVHQWRSEEQAILVGWKTVAQDNPSLTVRAVKGNNPLRIIIDPRLQAPKDSTVFTDNLPTLVINLTTDAINGNVTYVKSTQIDPQRILELLAERTILSVFVEGGSTTLQSFIDANLWDEARVIVSKHTFESGTKAPEIAQAPISQQLFINDTLLHFEQKG